MHSTTPLRVSVPPPSLPLGPCTHGCAAAAGCVDPLHRRGSSVDSSSYTPRALRTPSPLLPRPIAASRSSPSSSAAARRTPPAVITPYSPLWNPNAEKTRAAAASASMSSILTPSGTLHPAAAVSVRIRQPVSTEERTDCTNVNCESFRTPRRSVVNGVCEECHCEPPDPSPLVFDQSIAANEADEKRAVDSAKLSLRQHMDEGHSLAATNADFLARCDRHAFMENVGMLSLKLKEFRDQANAKLRNHLKESGMSEENLRNQLSAGKEMQKMIKPTTMAMYRRATSDAAAASGNDSIVWEGADGVIKTDEELQQDLKQDARSYLNHLFVQFELPYEEAKAQHRELKKLKKRKKQEIYATEMIELEPTVLTPTPRAVKYEELQRLRNEACISNFTKELSPILDHLFFWFTQTKPTWREGQVDRDVALRYLVTYRVQMTHTVMTRKEVYAMHATILASYQGEAPLSWGVLHKFFKKYFEELRKGEYDEKVRKIKLENWKMKKAWDQEVQAATAKFLDTPATPDYQLIPQFKPRMKKMGLADMESGLREFAYACKVTIDWCDLVHRLARWDLIQMRQVFWHDDVMRVVEKCCQKYKTDVLKLSEEERNPKRRRQTVVVAASSSSSSAAAASSASSVASTAMVDADDDDEEEGEGEDEEEDTSPEPVSDANIARYSPQVVAISCVRYVLENSLLGVDEELVDRGHATAPTYRERPVRDRGHMAEAPIMKITAKFYTDIAGVKPKPISSCLANIIEPMMPAKTQRK